MALLAVLNDIREQVALTAMPEGMVVGDNDQEEVPRLMPVAFVGVYSSFTSDPFLYPSMFMSASHWILTPCVVTSFMEAYIPHRFRYTRPTTHEQNAIQRELAPTDGPSRLSKAIDFGRWLFGRSKSSSTLVSSWTPVQVDKENSEHL